MEQQNNLIDRLKKVMMIASLVIIALGLGASVWLYTILHDNMSLAMIAIFFAALIWFGWNVWHTLKEPGDR